MNMQEENPTEAPKENPTPDRDEPPEQPAPFRILGDRAKLFGALSKARGVFSELETSRTAKIRGETQSGKAYEYGYDYADLGTLQDATVPALSANGLTIIQCYWDIKDGHVLLTILGHESGACLEVEVYIPPQKDVQKLGSAITYHKRYQWSALCGIAAKRDDDDGNSAVGNDAQTPSRQQKPVPAQKPKGQPPAPPAVQAEQQQLPQQAPQEPKEAPAQSAPPPELAQINAAIRKQCLALRLSRDEGLALCREVTGLAPDQLDVTGAQQVLAYVNSPDGMRAWLAKQRGAAAS